MAIKDRQRLWIGVQLELTQKFGVVRTLLSSETSDRDSAAV